MQSSLEKGKNAVKASEEPVAQPETGPIFGKINTGFAGLNQSFASSSNQQSKVAKLFGNYSNSSVNDPTATAPRRVVFENKRRATSATPEQELSKEANQSDRPLSDTEKLVKEAWPEALLSRDVDDNSYSSAKNKIVFRPE